MCWTFNVRPGMNGGTLCFRVVHPSVRHTLGVPLCVQYPAKTMSFQQIIMHQLHYQHDVDVHLLFCFDLDLHITCSRGRVKFDFLRRFSLVGTILRAASRKSIIMYALQCQPDIDVHLLFYSDHDLLYI